MFCAVTGKPCSKNQRKAKECWCLACREWRTITGNEPLLLLSKLDMEEIEKAMANPPEPTEELRRALTLVWQSLQRVG